jgi:hypothetical protein
MAKVDNDTSICFPGEEAWELWRLQAGRFELADTIPMGEASPEEGFKSASHYAFPVHSVFAVPIWAGTDDPELLGNLVEMQLEKTGLKPDVGEGVMLDYRIVSASDGRAPTLDSVIGDAPAKRHLALATVLNPNFAHPLPKSGSKGFDVSPRFLMLPGNHIIIWKELGRLVMALTRGGQLVYFQGLTSADIDTDTVHEVKCVLLGLEGQGVVAEPTGIHLWLDEIADSAGALLQREIGLDAIVTPRPDPVLPTQLSNLLPPEIARQRAAQKHAAKIRNIGLALAACYVALLGWYFFDYFKTVNEERQLAASSRELSKAEWMRPFRTQWDALDPVVNGERYPSELLHRCTAAVPVKDVRFTSFTIQGGDINIVGECRDPNAGRNFGTQLFKNSLLRDYDWVWLQRPTIDPRRKDGTASFRIQGAYKFKDA